jgi:RNA 2',3'-cyclic 3'-phosphodiesterase
LKFLGGVDASRIPDVAGAIERAAHGIPPFEVEIGGTGGFPNVRNPRVLWVGVSKIAKDLQRLYSNIEERLAHEGFEKEKRKFSPHLTIGRLRTPKNAARVAEMLVNIGFESETFTATQVIMMRSDLNPKGSIYTPQAVTELTRS